MLACVSCEEKGCDECNGTGRFAIESCPKELIESDIVRVAQAAEDMKNGHLPIAGGTLDQAAWVMSAIRTMNSETNRVEAESYKS